MKVLRQLLEVIALYLFFIITTVIYWIFIPFMAWFPTMCLVFAIFFGILIWLGY